jgi:hypothetical protein
MAGDVNTLVHVHATYVSGVDKTDNPFNLSDWKNNLMQIIDHGHWTDCHPSEQIHALGSLNLLNLLPG